VRSRAASAARRAGARRHARSRTPGARGRSAVRVLLCSRPSLAGTTGGRKRIGAAVKGLLDLVGNHSTTRLHRMNSNRIETDYKRSRARVTMSSRSPSCTTGPMHLTWQDGNVIYDQDGDATQSAHRQRRGIPDPAARRRCHPGSAARPHPAGANPVRIALLFAALLAASTPLAAQNCGEGGSPAGARFRRAGTRARRAAASQLLWLDGRGRVLIDARRRQRRAPERVRRTAH